MCIYLYIYIYSHTYTYIHNKIFLISGTAHAMCTRASWPAVGRHVDRHVDCLRRLQPWHLAASAAIQPEGDCMALEVARAAFTAPHPLLRHGVEAAQSAVPRGNRNPQPSGDWLGASRSNRRTTRRILAPPRRNRRRRRSRRTAPRRNRRKRSARTAPRRSGRPGARTRSRRARTRPPHG